MRRVRSWRLLGLAAALAMAPFSQVEAQHFGHNQVRYRKFDMRVMKTPRFDIYYYPNEEQAARIVARMAERWYARLSRLLDAKLPAHQPLILYASQTDFQQTNARGGQESREGTRGAMESFTRPVILPFAGSLGETDRLLGHQLVHAFQFAETSFRANGAMRALTLERMPLWFVEGMAEYLSIGSVDAHTAMWMRDAVAVKKLPRIKDLDKGTPFPNRWGQALWAYIAGRWGDPVVGRILHAAEHGDVQGAIEHTLGVKIDALSKDWHESLRAAYAPAVERARATEPKPLLSSPGRGCMNLAPAISPDGSQVLFLSKRSASAMELYLADTRAVDCRSRVTRAVQSTHADDTGFIGSAGAWDFSGKRFTYAVVEHGRPALIVRDVATGNVERKIALPQLGQVYNPTWSPDGQRVAFAALAGGVTDLFIYDLRTDAVTRLTDDPYGDLQPAWSPDGKVMAFSTDRFSSVLSDLRFGSFRLATIDPQTKAIEPLPVFKHANNINPQWSSDGNSVFFLADRDGVSNIYRLDRATGKLFQVTDVPTGIGGLTSMSPALSSASSIPRLTFTAYEQGRYLLYSLENTNGLAGTSVHDETATAAPAQHPPEERSRDPIVAFKDEVGTEPSAAGESQPASYRPRLALHSVTQRFIGVGLDRFGSYLGGGASLGFSDTLGDHNVQLTLQDNGGFSDIAALATYVNRRSRLNWGAFIGRIPFATADDATGYITSGYQEVKYVHRQIEQHAGLVAAYPLTREQRIETMSGYRRVSREQETRTWVYDPAGDLTSYDSAMAPPSPVGNLAEGSLALVWDTTVLGAISPLAGRACRFEIGAVAGSLHYHTFLADFRHYRIPVRPFIVATRMMYYGRFGPGADDKRLNPVHLGYSGLVRGYDPNSIDPSECETNQQTCHIIDRISGSQLAIANAELRFPLLGRLGGPSYFGPFAFEGALFVDAGLAWKGSRIPKLIGQGHQSVSSVGAALRANVFGFAVVEVDYVKPFDRPKKDHVWQFNFSPGF